MKGAPAADVTREIDTLLRLRHRIRPDSPNEFRIENPADVLTARSAATRILNFLLIAVASVSFVVGGIGQYVSIRWWCGDSNPNMRC
jgi:hypothetical protein